MSEEWSPRLGEVVASMLMLAQFNDVYGAGWVLADGRDVSGSEYHRLTGFSKVPDLRGIFLRGKSYDRLKEQANEEGDLPLGQYQPDAFKMHTHRLDPPSSNYNTGVDKQYDLANTGAHLMGKGYETQPSGGSEARSRNVTVNFFIRIGS